MILKSRGRESTTLTFVTLAFVAVTAMFLWKGGAADMLNYGTAVLAILAPWLQREWTEKVSIPKLKAPE